MNKAEKQLVDKVLAFHKSPSKTGYSFTDEESLILERWRVHKIVNENAFIDVTSMSSDHREYIQDKTHYPFTAFGDEEIKQHGYLKFRNSKGIIIVRDVLTVIAFLLSLYIAIANILQK